MLAIIVVVVLGAIVVVVANNLPSKGRNARPTRLPPELMHIEGSGEFATEAAGESHYQDALAEICGGRTEEGVEHECVAALIPEPGNQYDPNAVRIEIDGRTVGYLPKEHARGWVATLERRGATGAVFTCDALICGGWSRPRSGGRSDEGSFGVRLDLS